MFAFGAYRSLSGLRKPVFPGVYTYILLASLLLFSGFIFFLYSPYDRLIHVKVI